MRLRAVCNLLPGVADARRQLALDKRVNIFGIGVNVQSARLDVLFDFLKLRADLFAFAFVDDSRRAEHCGMRNAALNVLFVHAAVNRNRRVKVVRLRVCLLLEAAFP